MNSNHYSNRFTIADNVNLQSEVKLLHTLIQKDTIEDDSFHMSELVVERQLNYISRDLEIVGLSFTDMIQYSQSSIGIQYGDDLMREIIACYAYTFAYILRDFVKKYSNEEYSDELFDNTFLDVVYNDQFYCLGYRKNSTDKYTTSLRLWELSEYCSVNIDIESKDKTVSEIYLQKLVNYTKKWKKREVDYDTN